MRFSWDKMQLLLKVDTNYYLSTNDFTFSPELALTGRSYMLCREPVSTEVGRGGRWKEQGEGTERTFTKPENRHNAAQRTPLQKHTFVLCFLSFSNKISELFLSKDKVGVRIEKHILERERLGKWETRRHLLAGVTHSGSLKTEKSSCAGSTEGAKGFQRLC